jgi:hypothetical protein
LRGRSGAQPGRARPVADLRFSGTPLPPRFSDPFRVRHRTAAEIRKAGAIGSLNNGRDDVAQAWAQGGRHDMEIFDVVLAPCGVEHGIAIVPGQALWGGFAAPPQLDLYAHALLPGHRDVRQRAVRSPRRIAPLLPAPCMASARESSMQLHC